MKIAVIGAGDIGMSVAHGICNSGIMNEKIIVTRQKSIFPEKDVKIFECSYDNKKAVMNSDIIILAVQPKQARGVLEEIKKVIDHKKILISVVSGLEIKDIEQIIRNRAIVRAMPNIAIKVRQSMTCLAFNELSQVNAKLVEKIFNAVGMTLTIPENLFPEATVLCGSGTALALKFNRIFMQACIQHRFNKMDGLRIASQVIKGAAMLIQDDWQHPESEIDNVTTPGGCTIAALVEMEHAGFGSALLRAISVAIEKARRLYS